MMCFISCAKTTYPVTGGSYKSLPRQSARLLIWGTSHAEAETAVAAWLQKRGLVVLDRRQITTLNNRTLNGSPATRDEAALLQIALAVGADSVVFVETFGAMAPGQEPGPASSDGTFASVLIRGVDVKTGEVEWNAQAMYPRLSDDKDDVVANLACQALATVWGFRPAGYHEIPSADMCHIESPGRTPPTTRRQRLGRAEDFESSAG